MHVDEALLFLDVKIHQFHEANLRNATTAREVADVLQHVIKLEHATLHPYMTAIFSLKKGTHAEVEEHIRWVAMEEMLHMLIAANLILALGESPVVDDPALVPSYPGSLPMCVGDDLCISLEKYSPEQARNVFMGIEHPEDPLEFDSDLAPDVESHSTIGRLYHHLGKKLTEFDSLPGDPSLQLVECRPFTSDELFPILTVDDALRAIEIVVEQGEGTTSSPVSPSTKMAHYYRFQELAEGRRLVADETAESGYSFTGDVIEYEPDNVWNIQPNTKLNDIPAGTDARAVAEEFSRTYTEMVHHLHFGLNGDRKRMNDAVVTMQKLQQVGYEVCSTPFPGRDGINLGPTWELVG